jgi:hypothetical protein
MSSRIGSILPVSLAYDDQNGQRHTESHLINLLVNRLPKIQVDFYRAPDPGLVGEPLTLPIELVNIGRNMVNVSTAEISGENLEITTGSAYIGALDGGTSGSLDAVVIPQQSGSLPVQVSMYYLDDFTATVSLIRDHPVKRQRRRPGPPEAGQEEGLERRS